VAIVIYAWEKQVTMTSIVHLILCLIFCTMYFSPSIVGLVPLLCTRVIAAPSPHLDARSPLDDFVSKESAISLQGALNNIGPDGSLVQGAKAGFVVASPSKADPDCKPSNLSTAIEP